MRRALAFVWIILGLLGAAAVVLLGLRWSDQRADGAVWQALEGEAGAAEPAVFDPAMIAHLPEPAQRYFLYTITPGTPLSAVVEIDMRGELGFGDQAAPNYSAMQARQILAPPHGLVWRVRAGAMSGSDGATPTTSWTRFWLFGLIPIVRVGNDADHHRSAFGRVVAEGAFWAPASLLPGDHVRWEPLGADAARATVTYGAFEQTVDIHVAPDGQPRQVVIRRWSNENPDKVYRWQPFGGEPSDFRDFGGYRLPTRVEGGNHFGTEAYFPFYKAEVTDIRLHGTEPAP